MGTASAMSCDSNVRNSTPSILAGSQRGNGSPYADISVSISSCAPYPQTNRSSARRDTGRESTKVISRSDAIASIRVTWSMIPCQRTVVDCGNEPFRPR
jgi:hypothetical protein